MHGFHFGEGIDPMYTRYFITQSILGYHQRISSHSVSLLFPRNSNDNINNNLFFFKWFDFEQITYSQANPYVLQLPFLILAAT